MASGEVEEDNEADDRHGEDEDAEEEASIGPRPVHPDALRRLRLMVVLGDREGNGATVMRGSG